MATAKPNLVALEKPVRLFELGTWRKGTRRQKTYSVADADDICRNFREYQSGEKQAFSPPLVIGHEEKQEFADNAETRTAFGLNSTGIPRFGTPTKLWHDGKFLWANVKDVPKPMAYLMDAGLYDSVSAEIYDQPPEGVPGRGKMLRRIAMLGGKLPHIKTMAGVLKAAGYQEQFSESRPRAVTIRTTEIIPRAGGLYEVFSEVIAMNRDQMIEQLIAAGWTKEIAEKMEEDILEASCGVAQKFSEQLAAAKEPVKPSAESEAFSEEARKIRAELDTARKDARKITVDTFCEKMVQAGKILPAELDASHGGATIKDLLLELPAEPLVSKFSEGKEINLFDALRKILERRPQLVKFGERVKSPTASAADEEVAKVEKFSEEPAIAQALEASGQTKEQYIDTFKELKKKNPRLTARDYGVVETV